MTTIDDIKHKFKTLVADKKYTEAEELVKFLRNACVFSLTVTPFMTLTMGEKFTQRDQHALKLDGECVAVWYRETHGHYVDAGQYGWVTELSKNDEITWDLYALLDSLGFRAPMPIVCEPEKTAK